MPLAIKKQEIIRDTSDKGCTNLYSEKPYNIAEKKQRRTNRER